MGKKKDKYLYMFLTSPVNAQIHYENCKLKLIGMKNITCIFTTTYFPFRLHFTAFSPLDVKAIFAYFP